MEKVGTSQDVVILGHETPDGTSAIRVKDGTASLYTLRPAVDGEPIGDSEVVQLTPRAENPRICDVQTVYGGKGPAKVTSDSYREGYDAIFVSKGSTARN